MNEISSPRVVVIISANIEWQVLLEMMTPPALNPSPCGQWFVTAPDRAAGVESVLFFHGGWGKIAAAASTQYVIDRWQPELLINVGTCGGFAGHIETGTIILANRTLVYDIIEQMTDQTAALNHYATDIDLSWLREPYPQPVRRTLLVSGDRDLRIEDIPLLSRDFGAVAGDWESGAIAWVAARNQTRCLILRGVTDLVGSEGGEAYDGNLHIFVEGTRAVLSQLLPNLSNWIAQAR